MAESQNWQEVVLPSPGKILGRRHVLKGPVRVVVRVASFIRFSWAISLRFRHK